MQTVTVFSVSPGAKRNVPEAGASAVSATCAVPLTASYANVTVWFSEAVPSSVSLTEIFAPTPSVSVTVGSPIRTRTAWLIPEAPVVSAELSKRTFPPSSACMKSSREVFCSGDRLS